MIQKDLERYAQNNWSELMAAVTELSSSGQGKPSLVTSDKKFYNFDKKKNQKFEKKIYYLLFSLQKNNYLFPLPHGT